MARWTGTGARWASRASRLSNYGYERQGLGIDIGTRDHPALRLATDLQDELDSLGRTVHRYYFVHRLHARPSRRLTLASGKASSWRALTATSRPATATRFPSAIWPIPSASAIGGNVLLGLDVHWRAFRRTTFEAQLALDDF